MAAIVKFGASSELMPIDSIPEIFASVERGGCDYGVVPVENSLGGAIPETLDTFMTTNLRIVSEIFVPIVQNLATRCERLEDIQRIYSKAEPFAQCKNWLRAHVPNAEKVEVSSTAKAAELAAKEAGAAAICPSLFAGNAGRPNLVKHTADNSNNRTRFLALRDNRPEPSGWGK